MMEEAKMELSRQPADTRPGHIEIVVSDKEDYATVVKFVDGLEVAWEKALFIVTLDEQPTAQV